MRILDRYLLKEYVTAVLFCFTAFCLIYIVLDLFYYLSRFLDANTPPTIIAYYYLLWVLPFLEYLFPASLLFGALYTLWRMARKNEIIAMRAGGVSLNRIMAPFLGVAIVFALTTMVVKEWTVPATREWHSNFLAARRHYDPEALVSRPVSFIYHAPAARMVWSIGQFDANRPDILREVAIVETRENGTRKREIVAGEAQWLDGQWWLFGASVQAYRDSPFHVPHGPPVLLPSAGVEMRDLPVEPQDIAVNAKPWAFLSTREMLRRVALQSHVSSEDLARKRTDIHFRLAAPWACLVVTLFGIPVGSRSSRQNVLACLATAVACFVGYYALLHVGVFLAGNGRMPPWLGAWMSNAVFAVAGMVLIRKAD